MIRLSMNVASASLSLLRIIGSGGETLCSEVRSLYRISDIDVDDLIEMLTICRLVVKHNEVIFLSESGEKVLSNIKENFEECIRIFLCEYILHIQPIWSKRIPYGRFEASTFMTKDEKACFYEAGLLSEKPDYDVVLWWDKLSEFIRKRSDSLKNEIGRSGELHTIAYEKERVYKSPSWKSIDSNLLGYDIISISSKDDNTALLIEVKASIDDIEHAFFHISANEWRVANQSINYVFYLWLLCNGKSLLAIISPDEINPHMPDNNENGEWESVKIPFDCFSDKFSEWSGSV